MGVFYFLRMILKELILSLNKLFPTEYSFQNDNSGLQVGKLDADIKNILIALEVTEAVLKHAIENKIDLIITHHPLIFTKLNSISSKNSTGKLILNAIENHIAIYSMHTNVDSIQNGLNDELANLLDLQVIKPIEYLENVKLYKLVCFVPKSHIEELRTALFEIGIGKIGKYSHSSFNVEGKGTFLPDETCKPYIGKAGELGNTDETRFETILFEKDIANAINLIKAKHPYEEAAYDIYPLYNYEGRPGLGRYCKTKKTCTLDDFLKLIPQKFDIDFARYGGEKNKKINKLAICTGSGGSYINRLNNIDLFISGDISYHNAMTALEKDIAFIDIGHEQEKIFIPLIEKELSTLKGNLKLHQYKNTINPFKHITYKELPRE